MIKNIFKQKQQDLKTELLIRQMKQLKQEIKDLKNKNRDLEDDFKTAYKNSSEMIFFLKEAILLADNLETHLYNITRPKISDENNADECIPF